MEALVCITRKNVGPVIASFILPTHLLPTLHGFRHVDCMHMSQRLETCLLIFPLTRAVAVKPPAILSDRLLPHITEFGMQSVHSLEPEVLHETAGSVGKPLLCRGEVNSAMVSQFSQQPLPAVRERAADIYAAHAAWLKMCLATFSSWKIQMHSMCVLDDAVTLPAGSRTALPVTKEAKAGLSAAISALPARKARDGVPIT